MIWRWLAARLQPHLATAAATVGPSSLAPKASEMLPEPIALDQQAIEVEPTPERLRELMGQALSIPTPEAILTFVDFAHRLRRMGPYNILMVFTQRPGAKAVASRREWEEAGQKVRPDAIPILILRPKGPITQVFELLDTLPAQIRDPRSDAFGATGDFDLKRLQSVIQGFGQGKRKLRVEVFEENYGAELAGTVTRYGINRPRKLKAELLGAADPKTSIFWEGEAHWSIKLNCQLTPAEKFATLMHELGHLCCGHLGGFYGETPDADEYGWPDRSHLPHAAKEIEAELVAWHMCDREGIVTGSPIYLKPYLERANLSGDLKHIELDRVIRAIARIRQHAGERKPVATAKTNQQSSLFAEGMADDV